jgi:hypothetical protein
VPRFAVFWISTEYGLARYFQALIADAESGASGNDTERNCLNAVDHQDRRRNGTQSGGTDLGDTSSNLFGGPAAIKKTPRPVKITPPPKTMTPPTAYPVRATGEQSRPD